MLDPQCYIYNYCYPDKDCMCDDVADSGVGHPPPDTHSRQIVVVNKDVDQGKPFKVTNINLLLGYSRVQHLKMSPLGASLEVHQRRLLLEERGGRQEGGVDRDLRAELGDNLHLGELLKCFPITLKFFNQYSIAETISNN